MEKLIRNAWQRTGSGFSVASILAHDTHPEGLDVSRLRCAAASTLSPDSNVGHIISIIRGDGYLYIRGGVAGRFHLRPGVHLYLPPGFESAIEGRAGMELLLVSSASAAQARGRQVLLRDEEFLSACAHGSQPLRWILTPQYLSRRIFLRHDPVLLSKSGNPVSWFRTTMFDVSGLPANEDGEPVFKMSYNSRTEFNVCYEVAGTARVRMAHHPYRRRGQEWTPWLPLDGESTYHLNETPAEEEWSGEDGRVRNKHEVYIDGGHVTLFCLFDPAPTGVERHQPGEYSDYEPLERVMRTSEYQAQQRQIGKYDDMMDLLSFARATDSLDRLRGSTVWARYESGRQAQMATEWALARRLGSEGQGRERVVGRWMLHAAPAAPASSLHLVS